MKIVQINAVDSTASTGRTTKELADALIEKGHECRVFFGEGVAHEVYSVPIGNRFDHKVHALLSRITGLQGYFSFVATKRLILQLQQYKPDVVHLRNLHANYIHIPLLLNFLGANDIPTVITLHDCFMFTGKCFYPIDAHCEKWKTQCKKCKLKNQTNSSWIFDQSKRMYADKKKGISNIKRLAVMGVSRWVSEQAQLSFLNNTAKIHTIYNWVDLNKFFPRKETNIRRRYYCENKKIVLGVATNWNEDKGLLDFYKLADIMGEEIFIILIGHIASTKYDKNNILYIEKTDSIEMLAQFYSEADVFFNPSRRETFGKVTVEAMACGCPVVVYDNTASPELVGENCGYVVETNDVHAAVARIKTIFEKGKDSFAENCIEYVKDNFQKETNINRIISVYQELQNESE